MSNVFGLDIGTRNVVGTVGYLTEDDEFVVGHYSEDWGDIYGLVTDDAEQIEHLDQ